MEYSLGEVVSVKLDELYEAMFKANPAYFYNTDNLRFSMPLYLMQSVHADYIRRVTLVNTYFDIDRFTYRGIKIQPSHLKELTIFHLHCFDMIAGGSFTVTIP